MHKERILAIADVIEKLPLIKCAHHAEKQTPAFGMGQYQYACGTPSCIAGWAEHHAKYDDDYVIPADDESTHDIAKDYLGLTEVQASRLFLATETRYAISNLSPAAAAYCLRHLAATGRVAWTKSVDATKVTADA